MRTAIMLNNRTLQRETLAYDNYGRMNGLTVGQYLVEYGFHHDTSLPATTTVFRAEAPSVSQTRIFDHLGRLKSISASDGTNDLFSVVQKIDALNRVTRITLADDHYWDYGYDSMNQVTSGVKRDPAGTALPGYTFAYGFDTIGNRESATRESTTEAYTPNDLNQIESINYAGLLHLLGSADASANVTLNSQSVSRADSLYYGTTAGTNSLETITIEGRITGAGHNGTDAVALIEGEAYIPAGPTTSSHDESGNLREDARWLYTWDADGARQRGDGAPARACPKRHCREGGFNRVPSGRVKPQNRLIQMETRPALVTAGVLHQRLTFGYDSQSRRISKTVEHWDATTSSFITQNSSLFLWDGWLLLAEINATTQVPIQTYTWGPDISGSREATGGVGGLLLVRTYEDGSIAIPLYGNNGNVWSYWDTADNVTQAAFEYGPFGELLQASAPQANRLRHRFSTKPEDTETGFLYYGYRFYEPETGRWLNRDPIQEEGGLNIYGFLRGNPIALWDTLGLFVNSPSELQSSLSDYRDNLDTPKSQGLGKTHFNNLRLRVKVCPLEQSEVADALYSSLRSFEHFDTGNSSNIVLIGDIAVFWPNNSLQQLGLTILAHDLVSVSLTFFDSERRLRADTTGSHFLTGFRIWGINASQENNGELSIYTVAQERYASRRFRVSNAIVGMVDYVDFMNLTAFQSFESEVRGLWSTYLNNIVDEFIQSGNIIEKTDENWNYFTN